MNRKSGATRSPSAQRFTEKQGQYLALIYTYSHMFRRPPAETDMRRHFEVSPPRLLGEVRTDRDRQTFHVAFTEAVIRGRRLVRYRLGEVSDLSVDGRDLGSAGVAGPALPRSVSVRDGRTGWPGATRRPSMAAIFSREPCRANNEAAALRSFRRSAGASPRHPGSAIRSSRPDPSRTRPKPKVERFPWVTIGKASRKDYARGLGQASKNACRQNPLLCLGEQLGFFATILAG
jgi:hypothetical protein